MAEEIVTGILKKKSEVTGLNGESQYEIEFESPWFQSKFLQKFWLPLDVGAPLVRESTLKLVIYNAGLQENRDGSLRWHYKWRFVRIADDLDIESPNLERPAPKQPFQSAPAADEVNMKERRIMLQNATGHVERAFAHWLRLPVEDRKSVSFWNYLETVAVHATMLVDHLYIPGGYQIPEASPDTQPVEPDTTDTPTNDIWDEATES